MQRYQTLGTVVYLAMSGDATCRGIRSPRDGPVVMELTQGITKGIVIKDSNLSVSKVQSNSNKNWLP